MDECPLHGPNCPRTSYKYFSLNVVPQDCPRCHEEVSVLMILPFGNGCVSCCDKKGWIKEENGKPVVFFDDYRTVSW